MISRSRVLQWMRDMQAERQGHGNVMLRNNSTVLGPDGFTQKGATSVGADDYQAKVAVPTMEAVDDLPEDWRRVLSEAGYVDVYRAYKRRWPLSRVKEQADRNGGLFVL